MAARPIQIPSGSGPSILHSSGEEERQRDASINPSLASVSPSLSQSKRSVSRPAILTADVLFFADHLHLPPAPTEELYNKVVSPLVTAAMDGYDGTVFAYGSQYSDLDLFSSCVDLCVFHLPQ